MAKILEFQHPKEALLEKLRDYEKEIRAGRVTTLLIAHNGPDSFGHYFDQYTREELRHYIFELDHLKKRLLDIYDDGN